MEKNQKRFDGRKWHDQMMAKRVKQALEEKERVFTVEHQESTDEELLGYLRDCAKELKHSPFQIEVVGGKLIARRFGCWSQALRKADLLPVYGKVPGFTKRLIVQKEYAIQEKLYRAEKAAKQFARSQRRKRRAENQSESAVYPERRDNI